MNKWLFFLIALMFLPACMPDKSTTAETQKPPPLESTAHNEEFLPDPEDATSQDIEDVENALIKACKVGDLEVVKKLVGQGADVNSPKDYTPLFAACFGGHESIVSYLLAHGADVIDDHEPDCLDSNCEPLMVACREEHVGCVRLLLKHCKAKDIKLGRANFPAYEAALHAIQNEIPLHEAACEGNLEGLKVLLEQGAEVNRKGQDGATALHRACLHGHTGCAMLLIAHGATVDACDDSKNTPLLIASGSLTSNNECIQLLIKHGAQVQVRNESWDTPLLKACQTGDEQRVALLINSGADVTVHNRLGHTSLHLSKSCVTTNLLIDRGASLEAKDSMGTTPLGHACTRSVLEIGAILRECGATVNAQIDNENCAAIDKVKLLLERGADYTIRNNYGSTPLHLACGNSKHEIARLLLKAGASVEAVDNEGSRPLHLACAAFDIKVIQVLVAHGADIHARDKEGKTPLHIGEGRGYLCDEEFDCNAFLVSKGADVHAKDLAGRTPLHYACIKGYASRIQLLLQSGAQINVQDASGKTPLYYAQAYAQKYGRNECVGVLTQHGAVIC